MKFLPLDLFIYFTFYLQYYDAIYRPYEGKAFYWCLSEVTQPKGSGEVTLRSSNPYDPPIIDPKYFSHPHDLEVVVEGEHL